MAIDLQRLIDSANAPILGVDQNGCVSEWNQNMCNVTGYSKQEVLGIRLTDCRFIDPENRSSVAEVLDRALDGQDCQNFEFSLISKDSRRVELLLNAATRRNASGAIVGVVGVGQDITEKKYIEKAQVRHLHKTLPLRGVPTCVCYFRSMRPRCVHQTMPRAISSLQCRTRCVPR